MAIHRIYVLCPYCNEKNRVSRDTIAGLGGSGETIRTYKCKYCNNDIIDVGNKEIRDRGRD